MADRRRFLVSVLLLLFCVRSESSPYFDDFNFGDLYGNQCEAKLEEIQTSIKDLHSLLMAIGKAVDKDFKWQNPQVCPTGFKFLSQTGNCYRVVYENHDWISAAKRCTKLDSKAHLVSITSKSESDALADFLRSDNAKNSRLRVCRLPGLDGMMLWTSGQHLNETNCDYPFVWKESSESIIPFGYTKWNSPQPDCASGNEHCVHVKQNQNYEWNDIECYRPLCPICEYEPNESSESSGEEPEESELPELVPA